MADKKTYTYKCIRKCFNNDVIYDKGDTIVSDISPEESKKMLGSNDPEVRKQAISKHFKQVA